MTIDIHWEAYGLTDHPDKLQIDPSRVYRSFRRSEKRVRVYYFLWDHRRKKFTVREISAKTGIIKRDVIGILEGMGEMYGRDESLEGMGLVIRETEIYHGDLIQLYSIADQDLDVNKRFEEYFSRMEKYRVHKPEKEHRYG